VVVPGLVAEDANSVHRAKVKFLLFEIHVRLKNICHILAVTCDNAGTITFRGASTPAAITAPVPDPFAYRYPVKERNRNF
jgi:hypothetical protein